MNVSKNPLSPRLCSFSFFLVLLLASPAFAQERMARFENGLVVDLVSYRIFPVTSLGVLYDAGANHDPSGKQGLAHLVEHMMFRGTPRFRVSTELERMGASFNALTLSDRVIYYETFPTEYLDQVLSIEQDRMSNTVISDAGLDVEKRVVTEENQTVSAAITLDDVRDFYREFYKPGNVRLVLVGSFDFDQTLTTIAKLFDTTLASQSDHLGMKQSLDRDSPLKMMRTLTDASDRTSLLASSAVTVGAVSDRPRFSRDVLRNGLRVLLFSHPQFETVTIEAYVRAGSYFEKPRHSQLASLTARMMQENARDTTLEAAGAYIHFSAVSFNTYIESRGRPEHADALLAKLSAVVQKPRFSPDMLSSVKEKLFQELERKKTRPQYLAFVAASQRFYSPRHPFYMVDVPEQVESVKSFSVEDVAGFQRAHYRPAEAILVVVGNFNSPEMMAKIRKLFGTWKEVGVPSKIVIPRISPKEQFPDYTLHVPTAKRNEVFLTHPGLLRRNDSDYYASLIANTALGGSVLSSRLGTELRDRLGLVYEVRSEFFEATLGDGLWGITLDVAPARTDEAIATARDVVHIFSSEGIRDDEFSFHKSALKGAFLVSLSIPLALAGRILDAEFFGLRQDHVTNYGRDLDSVSREAVNRAIRRHFSADRLWAIRIGP